MEDKHLTLSGTVSPQTPSDPTMMYKRLTLANLRLWDALPDDTTGVIDHCGRFKLHRLHHIANTDLQGQRHHVCSRGGGDLLYGNTWKEKKKGLHIGA